MFIREILKRKVYITFSEYLSLMLSIKRIASIIPVPPRAMKVSDLRKVDVKVKTIRELSQFFKSLLEAHDLNALLSERKNLYRIEELAILRLIEEKDEKNKKVILSVLEDTREKIGRLNLKIYALLHEIPISENEINDWKKEIISIVDYIYNAQVNKLEYPPHIEDFLNSRISKLANLKDAVNHRIDELEKKAEGFEEELNNIKVKHSVGLLDEASYIFLKGRIEEILKNTIAEIKSLKNFNMQIGFISQIKLIENDLNETLWQISQVEEKYKTNEISADEYNRLIVELKRKEKNLNDQLVVQKRIYEDYREKTEALRGKIRSLDRLLV